MKTKGDKTASRKFFQVIFYGKGRQIFKDENLSPGKILLRIRIIWLQVRMNIWGDDHGSQNSAPFSSEEKLKAGLKSDRNVIGLCNKNSCRRWQSSRGNLSLPHPSNAARSTAKYFEQLGI